MGLRSGFAPCALLLLALVPAGAWAAKVNYEGELIPGNYDAPVRLKLQLDDEGGSLSGEGQAMAPSAMPVRFTGSHFGGMCSGTLAFANDRKAHLEGECTPERFNGTFKLFSASGRKVLGIFQLTGSRPKPEKAQGQDRKESSASEDSLPALPGKSPTVCLKLKIACLSGCPQGDYNAEFLCANGCRRKEAACLGKRKGARGFGSPAASPPAASSPYKPSFPEDSMPPSGGMEETPGMSAPATPP